MSERGRDECDRVGTVGSIGGTTERTRTAHTDHTGELAKREKLEDKHKEFSPGGMRVRVPCQFLCSSGSIQSDRNIFQKQIFNFAEK